MAHGDSSTATVQPLSPASASRSTRNKGPAPKKSPAPHKGVAAILLLVMLVTAACQPVRPDSDSRIGDAAQSFIDEVASNPSSCARDFRVLEPNITRTPQQMDLSAGYYQGVMRNTGDVSFVVKGQFPNSILLSWVIYDANGQVYSAVNDQTMTPDPENVNPFLPGAEVLASNRSYTVFFMPEGAAVPEGIAESNVLTLPPASTNDRIYITMRSYWPQPGYPRVGGPKPSIEAVSAADPTQPATCPGLGLGEGAFPLAPFTVPTPESGKILFFRPPNAIIPLADGTAQAEPNGCTGYALAQLSATDLNLVKIHKVPVFPDNQNYTESSVWTNDFEVRYVGLEANGASVLGPRSHVAMNDLLQQADGSAIFLTVPRPSDLTAQERLDLLEQAKDSNWNIMMSAGEGADVAPFLTYRNKLASESFQHSIAAIPCFGPDLGEWSSASADYASSPDNMGDHYIDGVICTVDEVLNDSCAQQLAAD